MKLWKKFAVALTIATLLYGGQIRVFTDNWNRFLEYWQFIDGLGIVIGILLLAVALVVVQSILAAFRWHWLDRLVQHLFLLALGTGLITSLLTYVDYKAELLNLLLIAVVAYSWARPQSRIIRRAAAFAMILSPFALISFYQLLRFPEWRAPLDRLPEARQTSTNSATPVFFFVFDEWSYARATTNGQFLSEFPNLRRLAEQSFVFHDAYSPGSRTHQSIPRMLFQSDFEAVKIGRDKMFVENDGKWTPTDETPSLFLHAREKDYQTFVFGFYLPYRKMLGEHVDVCRGYPGEPKADNLPSSVLKQALRNIKFWMNPVTRRIARAMNHMPLPNSKVAYSRFWFDLNQSLRDDTFAAVDRAPDNSFVFAHMPVPHSPFIFNADGGFRGAYKAGRMSGNIQDYHRSLLYLDKLIGELMDRLKAAGKFDDALLILTSDHSWRLDYTRDGVLSDEDEVRHVPLLIKCPRQQTTRDVAQTFSLVQLGPIVNSAFDGKADDASVLELLRQSPVPAKKPHRPGQEPKEPDDESSPASVE